MPLRPFWRELPARGRRVIALDVPLCYSPEQDPGIEVSGWATHELIQEPGSSPPGLLREIRREFGRTPLRTETSHQLSLARCLAIRDECMETARQVGELLGVHENWVYDHAASGELPSYKIGGTRRFVRDEINGYIAEHREPKRKRPERRPVVQTTHAQPLTGLKRSGASRLRRAGTARRLNHGKNRLPSLGSRGSTIGSGCAANSSHPRAGRPRFGTHPAGRWYPVLSGAPAVRRTQPAGVRPAGDQRAAASSAGARRRARAPKAR